MPFPATGFRLLISAPGDVTEEDFRVVTRAVERWNALYGVGSGAVVIPTSWAEHSASRYGARPQSVLNEQLVDVADIVIALFWSRLGSPTGEAKSGTLEEIERAHQRGAYVGILRCERPVDQDTLDPEQLVALRGYFDEIRGQALYLGYDDAGQLARHVEAILNQAVARASAAPSQPVPDQFGASVWPRVDRERFSETDSRGGLKTRTRWRFVLVNDGAEPARDVTCELEPYGEGSDGLRAPEIYEQMTPIEVLGPRREISYSAGLDSGTTSQARCVVRWSDSAGDHKEVSIVSF